MLARSLGVLVLVCSACQRVPLGVTMDPFDETEGMTDTDGTTGDVDPTGGPSEPGFSCTPNNPASCPEGQKCTAISTGGPQNKFECVTDDAVIPPLGECTPSPQNGQDGCPTGHVCLLTGDGDDIGLCLQACAGHQECEPGACEASPSTLTPFCADPCNPVFPSCFSGFVCRPVNDRFVCGIPVAEADIGQQGDPCDSQNLRGCAEGYVCLTGALVPNCGASDCCTQVCDLDFGDDQCPHPALCRAMFASPAPGFEDVGACYVPA